MCQGRRRERSFSRILTESPDLRREQSSRICQSQDGAFRAEHDDSLSCTAPLRGVTVASPGLLRDQELSGSADSAAGMTSPVEPAPALHPDRLGSELWSWPSFLARNSCD